MMNKRFAEMIESLEAQYRSLIGMTPIKYGAFPRKMWKRGIYLFSEADKHLYVGRTNRLRARLRDHCAPSGTHTTATFAFLLARHDTGRLKATYTQAGSRQELLKDPIFSKSFESAKKKMALMDIRYVEETDPTRQALLEIYVAIALGTPYNDFDTH